MTARLKTKPVGICPACGEAVYNEREGDGGPVWTCPADLSSSNPYWQPPLVETTEAEKEKAGFYGECCEESGANHGQCYERLPLHGACYDKGEY